MERQYLVILLILVTGLNTQAQTNVSMPVDSTLHLGLNSYVQPVSLTLATTVPQQDTQHYLRTAKTYKTLGWFSLGIGVPVMIVGLLGTELSAVTPTSDGGRKTVRILFVSGATLTVSNIPFFIVSHHYKKKVVSLSLGSQQVFVPQGNRFVSNMQPALSLRVSL